MGSPYLVASSRIPLRSVRNVGRTAGNDGGSQTCLKMTSVARVVLLEGDAFMRFAGMRLRFSIGMNRESSPSSSSRSKAQSTAAPGHGSVVTALPALESWGARLEQGRHCPCAGRCEKYPPLCFDFPNGRRTRAAGSGARNHASIVVSYPQGPSSQNPAPPRLSDHSLAAFLKPPLRHCWHHLRHFWRQQLIRWE